MTENEMIDALLDASQAMKKAHQLIDEQRQTIDRLTETIINMRAELSRLEVVASANDPRDLK